MWISADVCHRLTWDLWLPSLLLQTDVLIILISNVLLLLIHFFVNSLHYIYGSVPPQIFKPRVAFSWRRTRIPCCNRPSGFITNINMATVLTYEICATTSSQGRASILFMIMCLKNRITDFTTYTGCPRRNVRDFGRVFLMLNYADITQNTYIQSWTVKEIMANEKCGLLGCPRTVRRPWRHTYPLRMPGNETPLANIVMQWPWRDNGSAAACIKYLET